MKSFKKIYFLLLFFQFFILSFFYKIPRILANEKENFQSSNFEEIISDSIEPPCFDLKKNTQVNNIKINIPRSRKWTKNAFKASINLRKKTGADGYIDDKFKKRFNAFISYENANTICKNKGRIRISGDLKDHIKFIDGNVVPSLDITMNGGSINGVKKFKLFLPNTRNGDNEVFVANLFSELGLLSPRTRIMNVDINNIKVKMIFQEKFAKEFLENNSLRESVLVKTNDSVMWDLRDNVNGYFNAFIYPAIINTKWLSKGDANLKIGIKALNLFSSTLQDATEDYINEEVPVDFKLLNGIEGNDRIMSEQSFFSLLTLISRSIHLNFKHNIRYYYEPFNNSLIPVYYDGMSEILTSKIPFNEVIYDKKYFFNNTNIYLAMLLKNYKYYDFPYAINKLKNLNVEKFYKRLNKAGLETSLLKISKIKEELIDNLNILYSLNENIKDNPKLYKISKKEIPPQDRKYKEIIDNINILSGDKFSNLIVCTINSKNCENSSFLKDEFYKISKGDFKYNKKRYFFFNRDYKTNKSKITRNKIYKIKPFLKIKVFGNPELLIKDEEKKIHIIFKSPDDKIVFFDSNINNWDIHAKAYVQLIPTTYNSRIDENLLTSSLTIKNSKLKDLNIYFENGVHEDSVNIIKSSGSINSIIVKNSFQDAIDLDFSDLLINKIKVDNADNDCLDISAGSYKIDKITSSQCGDKAISVGEASDVNIGNLEIDNSAIGVVIKDSSSAHIKKAKVENSKICLALYRKKQEFTGSYLEIPKQTCDKNKIFVQSNSILKFL